MLDVPPGSMPELMPAPVKQPERWSPVDRWGWLADARAAAHDDDREFSSFAPGAEPDIWPQMERNLTGLII